MFSTSKGYHDSCGGGGDIMTTILVKSLYFWPGAWSESRYKCLVDRLLSQGYRALSLEKSFKKFYGRYQDLIEKYQKSVNVMVNDSFPG